MLPRCSWRTGTPLLRPLSLWERDRVRAWPRSGIRHRPCGSVEPDAPAGSLPGDRGRVRSLPTGERREEAGGACQNLKGMHNGIRGGLRWTVVAALVAAFAFTLVRGRRAADRAPGPAVDSAGPVRPPGRLAPPDDGLGRPWQWA